MCRGQRTLHYRKQAKQENKPEHSRTQGCQATWSTTPVLQIREGSPKVKKPERDSFKDAEKGAEKGKERLILIESIYCPSLILSAFTECLI